MNFGTDGAHVRSVVRFLLMGFSMFDAQTTALLRAVLDEVCENVSKYETGARTHVASKLSRGRDTRRNLA